MEKLQYSYFSGGKYLTEKEKEAKRISTFNEILEPTKKDEDEFRELKLSLRPAKVKAERNAAMKVAKAKADATSSKAEVARLQASDG